MFGITSMRLEGMFTSACDNYSMICNNIDVLGSGGLIVIIDELYIY